MALSFLLLPRELRDRVYTLLLIHPITAVTIAIVPNQTTTTPRSAGNRLPNPCETTLCKTIYTLDPSLSAPHTAIFLVNRQLNIEAWQTLAREGVVQALKLGRAPLRLSYLSTQRPEMVDIAREVLEDRVPTTQVTEKHSGKRISLYATKEDPLIGLTAAGHVSSGRPALGARSADRIASASKVRCVDGDDATTRDTNSVDRNVAHISPSVSESQTGAFLPQHINQACGERRRTPILESVRWNNKPMFKLLLEHGADPKAKAQNPFVRYRLDWTALHIFAHEGHNARVELVDDMVSLGVFIDGDPSASGITETPMTVAINNNAFGLASNLLDNGADINALSTSSGLIATKHPTSILGQMIASNARHSTPRLRYILSDCSAFEDVDFIVEPERQLSALHRAALACHDLRSISSDSTEPLPLRTEDFDMATNRDIMYELLQRFNTPEQLNMRCKIRAQTALHLAVEVGNIAVVKELTSLKEVDLEAVDEGGKTPADILRTLLLQPPGEWSQQTQAEMRGLLPLLETKVDGEAESLSQELEASLVVD
ncbi:MAG: hypothetical protein M1836_004643 [Candelina mexicana]|nr:MAG: hypothetical protein M1836_004643 [Candelina mexicana]